MVLVKNKKTHSRYSLKNKNKNIRKSNKSNTKCIKSITLKKQQKGGGEIESTEEFFTSLSINIQHTIQRELKNSIHLTNNLETIISNQLVNTSRLYDFIYQNQSQSHTPTLLKIWDHGINNPESITAGLPGIHIYTIISNNEAKIIGTFIRQ
jgi:hypothetical protein